MKRNKQMRMLHERCAESGRFTELCRNAERMRGGYVRCKRDGSIRDGGCPCHHWSGSFRSRFRVAWRFLWNG